MYHLYHTEGFVLGSRPLGEANKIFSVLTPDLGLLRVAAQSIRAGHSKMRGNMLELSYVALSLVRGREVWRLTNAERKNIFSSVFEDKDKVKIVTRLFSLVVFFIHGEEQSKKIFNDLYQTFVYLESVNSGEAGKEILTNLEHIAVLRLVAELGYLKREKELMSFVDASVWTDEMVKSFTPHRRLAARTINLAFEHSHI